MPIAVTAAQRVVQEIGALGNAAGFFAGVSLMRVIPGEYFEAAEAHLRSVLEGVRVAGSARVIAAVGSLVMPFVGPCPGPGLACSGSVGSARIACVDIGGGVVSGNRVPGCRAVVTAGDPARGHRKDPTLVAAFPPAVPISVCPGGRPLPCPMGPPSADRCVGLCIPSARSFGRPF